MTVTTGQGAESALLEQGVDLTGVEHAMPSTCTPGTSQPVRDGQDHT